MKKIFFALCLTGFVAAGAFAQETENYPYHTISKDVQKIQFKAPYVPSVVTTGNLEAAMSKGVATVHSKRTKAPAVTINTPGIPPQVISKGVARMQYERSLK
jgi:hypothetical protein